VEKNKPLQKWEQKEQEILRGDSEKIQSQHDKGKKTARERINSLFDSASFVELEALNQSGVICGYGLAGNRPVFAVSQDITVKGAAMGEKQASKIIRTLDLAKTAGAPVVFFIDTEGFLVEENALTLKAYAKVFAKIADLNGFCPTITLIGGESFGVAAQFAALTDFAVATKGVSAMLPFSPAVLSTVGNAPKDAQSLGGADTLSKNGNVAISAESEDEAIISIKKLLALLPSFASEKSPYSCTDDINRSITADGTDGMLLLNDLADKGSALELYKYAGIGVHTAFARVGGHACLMLVSEPRNDNGRLCHKACKKIAKLVKFASSFKLPIINFVSSDGLKVVPEDKLPCLLANSAEMTRSLALSASPKVCVVFGNAIGASYISAASSSADLSFVWPEAMVSPLAKEAAVQTFDALKLKDEKRSELEASYARAHDGLSVAQLGLADKIIKPSESRKHIIAALELLYMKEETAKFI
jgi:acetyl-CoA carboxylase carboxyltransferase component